MHILDGNALDLVKECDGFEKQIKDAGGVHLFIGGRCKSVIGMGHSIRNN